VEGEGVIGKQPIMQPGESHEYVSWSPLFTGLGRMYGSYLMQRVDNKEEFNVAIPEFQLVIPSLLN
jgi:ApaG protein